MSQEVSEEPTSAITDIDRKFPEVVIDTTDLWNLQETDVLNNVGYDSNDPNAKLAETLESKKAGVESKGKDKKEDKKRSPKPYKEAVTGARTKASMVADDIGLNIFDLSDDIDNLRRPLSEVQSDTMERIRNEIKGSNGLTSISTFTGCGGSDTGFAWAGFDPLLSVEFVDAARETLAANYKSYIITPASLVEEARKIAADMEIELKFEKKRRVKGKIIPPSIDWPLTLNGLTRTQQNKLRYEVTMFGLKQNISRDQTPIFGDDIRGMSAEAVMDFLNIKPGELDVFEGSPPCKSFSTAGSREDSWGKILHYSGERHQQTDDLFWEYVRLLASFKPKAFIAENVEGIGMGEAERQVLVPLMRQFSELGYSVQAKLVNSKDYGVPQSRPRMFFVGIRKDLLSKDGRTLMPKFPRKWDEVYTVQDALDFASPSNTAENLAHADMNPERPEPPTKYEIGRIWSKLGHGDSPSNKAYQTVRSHPNRPAPTITATSAGNQPAAGVMHPHENRKFTIPEYKSLFGFPQDYVFTGDLDQQGERMGRCVPPFLMKQLAESIAETIKKAVIPE